MNELVFQFEHDGRFYRIYEHGIVELRNEAGDFEAIKPNIVVNLYDYLYRTRVKQKVRECLGTIEEYLSQAEINLFGQERKMERRTQSAVLLSHQSETM